MPVGLQQGIWCQYSTIGLALLPSHSPPVEMGCQRGTCSADGTRQGVREEGTPGAHQPPAGAHTATPESALRQVPGAKHGVQDAKIRKSWSCLGRRKASRGHGTSRMRQQLTRGKGGGEGAPGQGPEGTMAMCGEGASVGQWHQVRGG